MPTPLYEYRYAASRFGGPIALIRDETLLLEVGSAYDPSQSVHIAASNGKVCGKFPWRESVVEGGRGSGVLSAKVRSKGRLVGFGWTSALILLCVDDTGSVFQYDAQGELLHSHFSALSKYKSSASNPFEDEPSEADSNGHSGDLELVVTHCQVWDEGVVVVATEKDAATGQEVARRCFSLLSSSTNAIESGFMQVEELRCPDLDQGKIHSLCVAEPLTSISGKLEVFLAVGDHIWVADAQSCEMQTTGDKGPFPKMSLCPNGQLLAAITCQGELLVVSTDFDQWLTEFQTHKEDELGPDQVVWCGVDSVVIRWDEEVVMVGPFGDSIAYAYDDSVILVSSLVEWLFSAMRSPN